MSESIFLSTGSPVNLEASKSADYLSENGPRSGAATRSLRVDKERERERNRESLVGCWRGDERLQFIVLLLRRR